MLYSELQEIRNLKTEEKFLNNVLQKINKHNKTHNTECESYSRERISEALKEVQSRRHDLIKKLNGILKDERVYDVQKDAIKLFYINNMSLEKIQTKLSHKYNRVIVFNNFHRDVKDLLYKEY